MSAPIHNAIVHWSLLEPLLEMPKSEEGYDQLVLWLDEILGIIGDDENHPLASLASHMGNAIEAYDDAHRPMPGATGVETLRYLMLEHGIAQHDLVELGPPSVVSAILNGERRIDSLEASLLSKRFNLPARFFLELP